MEYPEGVVENQRVDIILQNAQLQEYVSFQKFAELNGEMELGLKTENLEENEPVILNTSVSDKVFKVNKDGFYKLMFKKRLEKNYKSMNLVASALYKDIPAEDKKEIDLSKFKEVEKEFKLDNFEAILRFDYNIGRLSDENKQLLKQLSDLLPENSTIIIFGSTDALGTEKRNAWLANERAANTQNYIKSVSKKKFEFELRTDGSKLPEDTQQGRFLNRSIKIRVRKNS